MPQSHPSNLSNNIFEVLETWEEEKEGPFEKASQNNILGHKSRPSTKEQEKIENASPNNRDETSIGVCETS
jgi:hypothetical protein